MPHTYRHLKYPLFLDLPVAQRAMGSVRLPGSKSISNRILLLAALADGATHILDLLSSDDTNVMLSALRSLGIVWQHLNGSNDYIVYGQRGNIPTPHADLFLGNAGTAIRPLAAVLAVIGGEYKLHGIPRMHERPIGDLVDALNAIGANIQYTGVVGYPPLSIHTGNFHQHTLSVRGNISSQFLTALLMAAPFIAKDQAVTINVIGELISKPYVNITLNLMARFGVKVVNNNWQSFTIQAGQHYISPDMISVEGDASSASYFLAAGAISGGPVRVEGVGKNSIQGDVHFIDVLTQMGAHITQGDNWIQSESNGTLKAIDIDCNHIPDAAMTIAMLALHANGTTRLNNIGSWRVKETDRISAMATELRKLGAIIEDGHDYLCITPPDQLRPATIQTYDDHRIAMCFSLASLNGRLRNGVAVRINEPHCVAKTFPDYFQEFSQITSH